MKGESEEDICEADIRGVPEAGDSAAKESLIEKVIDRI